MTASSFAPAGTPLTVSFGNTLPLSPCMLVAQSAERLEDPPT